MHIRNGASKLTVHFLRIGGILVVGAKPRLDVADRDLVLEAGQRGYERRGRIAVDENEVRLFFVQDLIEAEQHAWQAVARAIETGLPVVRVGNSGVTGTITPDGKATWLLGPNGKPLVDRQGTMMDKIRISSTPTPTIYTSLGDWPLGIAFALLTITLILVKYRHRYE